VYENCGFSVIIINYTPPLPLIFISMYYYYFTANYIFHVERYIKSRYYVGISNNLVMTIFVTHMPHIGTTAEVKQRYFVL